VATLIQVARANGRTAYFVPTEGFDDVLSRLARHCLTADQRQTAASVLAKVAESHKGQRLPFTIDDPPVAAVLKGNAFEVECRSEVFAFDLKQWPKEKVWAWVEGVAKTHNCVAVPFRKVLALGALDDIRAGFAEHLTGTIERAPIGPSDTRYEDGPVV